MLLIPLDLPKSLETQSVSIVYVANYKPCISCIIKIPGGEVFLLEIKITKLLQDRGDLDNLWSQLLLKNA